MSPRNRSLWRLNRLDTSNDYCKTIRSMCHDRPTEVEDIISIMFTVHNQITEQYHQSKVSGLYRHLTCQMSHRTH